MTYILDEGGHLVTLETGVGFLLTEDATTGFWTIDGGHGVLPQLLVELDVTNLPTNPTRVWTDITGDIRSLSFTRAGRQDELQRTQPGTLTMTLTSTGSKYDPANPSGIGIKRAQWLRVRAQWNGVVYPRWQGIVETVEQEWPEAGADAIATVSATDATKVFNLYDLDGQTFPQQTSDARLSAICALANLTATIDDTGVSTLVAVSTPFGKQSYATQHLQDVELTEAGFIFAGPAGDIVFQSRHYRLLNKQTATATIGDTAGTVRYRDDVQYTSDDAYLVNKVTVTSSDNTDYIASDSTSADANFERSSASIDRTLLISDAQASEATAAAQYLVARYKDPSQRVSRITLNGMSDPTKWGDILGLNNSDRVTFARAASFAVSQDCYVEQVSDQIVPGAWSVGVQLSPADATFGWILGDAVYGVLGTTSIPVY